MFWKRLSYFDKFGGVSEEQKLFKGQIGINEWNWWWNFEATMIKKSDYDKKKIKFPFI